MPSHNAQPTEDTTKPLVSNGHLEVLQVLGQGSFGTVCLAESTADGSSQYYAVKCMQRYDSSDPETDMQAQEIAIHENVCDHHNIVNVHNVDGDADYVYVIMDYCSGGDMLKAINRGVYANNDELIKKVFIQLLDAVQHCHECGVFHRDLKPENILCKNRRGDSIRLADFGLASTNSEGVDFGVGTRPYLSPESYSGCSSKPFSYRPTDVWALGLILINMITGDQPWKSPSLTDGEFNKFVSDPNTLRKKLSTVSDATFQLILQALDTDPATRIQIPELRTKVQNLGSIYKKKPTRPPVPPKPLQLISPNKRVGRTLQQKPAKRAVPAVPYMNTVPPKEYLAPVIIELKECVIGKAVVPMGDGFFTAVT